MGSYRTENHQRAPAGLGVLPSVDSSVTGTTAGLTDSGIASTSIGLTKTIDERASRTTSMGLTETIDERERESRRLSGTSHRGSHPLIDSLTE